MIHFDLNKSNNQHSEVQLEVQTLKTEKRPYEITELQSPINNFQ